MSLLNHNDRLNVSLLSRLALCSPIRKGKNGFLSLLKMSVGVARLLVQYIPS